MQTNLEFENIEHVLAQADELIQQISSEIRSDTEDAHLMKLELRARNLKKIQSEVQSEKAKSEAYQLSHSTEGIHEAIQEIAKAMEQYKRYLAGDRPNKVE
ncbi:hypothetical protein [Desulfatibacillum aliphaticivorans]|uniref:hypothetical protein n=1 Tax=Desulfatibacillum aliphaticivorans TaxID=218208 RepID=UPI000486DF8A|nr:hypothetical protein [Desulfatibacillum aliphaticivorans]